MVSENNTTHAKAAPSQGVMSPRPVDSVGAASELTGTPHGPHPYVETPLAQHPDIALPQIGGGAHLPPEAQQASAAAPRYTAMAPVDPARTASLEAPGRPIVTPSTTFGKPFEATSSAALETHETPPTAVSSASAHGCLSSGDRTMPGLSAVSSRTPPPLSQDASSPGHNAGFLAGPQSPHDRAVSTSFAGESATRIEPRAGPLPADPGLNGSTTSSGSTKIVVVPGAPSLPSKDLAASRDGMQMGDQPVADADDRFIVAKDLESSAGGVPHEPVPRATAMHDSHVDNGTEGAFGIGPGIMKTSSVVTSFKASEGITPSRFRSEDKDDVGTTSVGSSAPGSGSGDALPMVSSYAGNVPDDRLGRVPVKFGLGGPANDEARVRAHGTDAGGGGHAPCGREEDGQRGGANGALPGAGEGAAVGMGASTMRTQAHDHDGQPPTDSQRREGGRSMGLLPTSQTEAPRDVGEEETW
ncbi:hypothetical protein OF83DRAFT_90866 [Amylostereum chailletii]|nr:hypothetical protein OF83DRAFT_90866 [Amylostereum chailletii]